jgi:hypothetical protein
VLTDIDTGEVFKFYPASPHGYVDEMLKFLDECKTLIFHNGLGFDFPLLTKLFGYEFKGQIVDTLIMSRLLFPKRTAPKGCKGGPHSVESWGMTFGHHKPEHEDWSKFTDEMLHRCSEDVVIQKMIYDTLMTEANRWKGLGADWFGAFKLTFRVFEILQKQEDMAWMLDFAYIEKCVKLLDHWMNRIDNTLEPIMPMVCDIEHGKEKGVVKYYKNPFTQAGKVQHYIRDWLATLEGVDAETTNADTICGPFTKVLFRPVDIASNAETKDYLLASGWIPEKWNYKKDSKTQREIVGEDGKKIPTSPKLSHDEAFIGVQGGIGRLIARRVQCRHRKSVIMGWLENVRDDGRLPQVITGIAATGRLTHKNIVNVPNGDAFFGHQMRRIFVCPEGRRIVGTDSAGCQLRMLAGRMGDKDYQDVILNGDKSKGTDIHTVNQKAAGLEKRGQAKTFIYGFLFGAGDAKIGAIVGSDAKAGRKLKDKFLEGLPALGKLLRRLTREWRRNAKRKTGRWGRVQYYDGWIRGLDGRPIRIESEHQILVYALQSDEAIMMQYALCFLYKWCTDRGWTHGVGYGFVANVHDEFQAEVDVDIADEFAALAEKAIVKAAQYLKLKCPHAGESDIGLNWSETH